MNREDKLGRYCSRYLAGEMTDSEEDVFKLELNINPELNKIYNEYKFIWINYPIENMMSKDKTCEFPHSSLKNTKKAIMCTSCFVTALLIASLVFLFSGSKEQFSNQRIAGKGQRLTVFLPDSSKVTINSESEIKYSDNYLKDRKVWLKGEAFFDVVHDCSSPFIVYIEKDLKVKVYGTRFNVNTFRNLKEISLVQGKVSVLLDNRKEVFLNPKEQLQWNAETESYSKKSFDVDFITSWKDDYLKFNNTPLEEAIVKINQFYGIKLCLENKNMATKCIKGVFKDQPLREFLEMLEFIGDFKIQQNSIGNYIIYN